MPETPAREPRRRRDGRVLVCSPMLDWSDGEGVNDPPPVCVMDVGELNNTFRRINFALPHKPHFCPRKKSVAAPRWRPPGSKTLTSQPHLLELGNEQSTARESVTQ